MRPTPLLVAAALALAGAPRLAAARSASSQGSGVALGVGADYLTDPKVGEFQLTLAVEKSILRSLTVGARFGVALLTESPQVGVPIDVRLRLRLERVYVDGLAGPWVMFGGGDALRLHAALGFGLLASGVSLGVEVGWLDPSPVVGLRLAFSI